MIYIIIVCLLFFLYVLFMAIFTSIFYIIISTWKIFQTGIKELFLFKLNEIKKTNGNSVAIFFMKIRILIYILSTIAIFLFFKKNLLVALLISGILAIFFFGIDILIKKLFGCRVCKTKGYLNGYNEYLKMSFCTDKCFVCHGGKLVFNDSTFLYNIILKTRREIKRLKDLQARITIQLQQYSSEVKIRKNENVGDIIRKDSLIRDSFLKKSEAIEAKVLFYQEIEKNSHIVLYQIYILLQQNEWQKVAIDWNNRLSELSEKVLASNHETGTGFKFMSTIRFFEEVTVEDSKLVLSPELKLDIERATQTLQFLFDESNREL